MSKLSTVGPKLDIGLSLRLGVADCFCLGWELCWKKELPIFLSISFHVIFVMYRHFCFYHLSSCRRYDRFERVEILLVYRELYVAESKEDKNSFVDALQANPARYHII